MTAFQSASIILPVMNETYSLRQTVEIIEQDCSKDVKEYLIVVCDRTKKESLEVCEEIKSKYGSRVKLHIQKLPFIGGAIREAFELASGSHTVLMASDLETPPEVVKVMIELVKQSPNIIVTASRWIKGGKFYGYNPLKKFLNFIFQRIFSIFYFVSLTDMTYAYRIFPTKLVQSIQWEELKHPFLLETIVKPLRLGVKVKEIPAIWKARTEGESQNTFFANFVYFRIGFRARFMPKSKILKPNITYLLSD
ncbi:MAG: glycosyltransferase [Candidatus Thermochlorobacter aerophilum]|jgi:glycosyltransferase involved in cell wall biosynthesis|uniref:Glycosyltransferase n=1 Tax=Candidatus Thermochlorobacter aerophilus TaxID=1868324 RepID=A0A395LWQ1_9BACT|nr:MAG: glycosyltransferase [Candidatus Thermochlorobacter aerophilum]